jgi:hypothetical protein
VTSEPKQERSVEAELTPEEIELLENLDLVVDWELLKEWDPGTDLPSSLDSPAPADLVGEQP